MEYTHDNRHCLPSTLEPPTRPDEMMTDPVVNNSAKVFDRNSGQLPGLNSLDLYQQEQNQEDYIRIKLSGMSVCVSPNSPRGGSSQERASIVNEFPPSSRYGPIRSLRRIVHPDQRRHSIANVDSTKPVNFHQERPPLPQQEQRQYHHQPHNSHPGHYSAPSSPPLLNQKYSPYARKQSIPTHHLLDQESPLLKTVMRRNSSAVMYRETDHSTSSTRRMSMNQPSRNNPIVKTFQETTEDHVKTEEEESESIYSRSPELRVSHKLAERKRRKEMKDLFDELKNTLPVDKSLKTSKWEILSKAVEYINLLRHKDYNMEQELLMLKHELESLKNGTPLYSNN